MPEVMRIRSRAAFSEALAGARVDACNITDPALHARVAAQLDHMARTTADDRVPTDDERAVIDLAPPAARHLETPAPRLADTLEELDYTFRRYPQLHAVQAARRGVLQVWSGPDTFRKLVLEPGEPRTVAPPTPTSSSPATRRTADAIVMHDQRGRWADVSVTASGFVPWRLAASPDGGVWVLEQSSGRLARLSGSPLPLGPFVDYAGPVFRPNPENCHPPTLRLLDGPAWPVGERALALACHPTAGLALLSWVGDGEARLGRLDTRTERLQAAFELGGARYAYALEWIDATQLVVRLPGRGDAPAFHLDAAENARPIAI